MLEFLSKDMKQEGGLQNQLKAIRTRLGLGQQELARIAGIARQTVGGIEAGLYAPSAAVALRLAKALGCRVEDLFWLEEDLPAVDAVPATALPADTPLRLALAKVGDQWVAHPLHGEAAFRTEMIPADGTGTWRQGAATLRVQLLDDPQQLARSVVVAGCTPALSLWARAAERWHPGLRVHWVHANSMAALESLARGEVHAAGLHLCDPVTGQQNAPYVRQVIADRAVVLVNLGVWEEGLVVFPGNPKQLHQASDLAREDVVLVNRERGAGSRLLLDTWLHDADVPVALVRGYDRVAHSHQDVVRTLRMGQADVGVSTASLAAAYGLGFVPIREVRYDLAVLTATLDHEPVRQLLGTLHHNRMRTQLARQGGYNTAQTGETVAVTPGNA